MALFIEITQFFPQPGAVSQFGQMRLMTDDSICVHLRESHGLSGGASDFIPICRGEGALLTIDLVLTVASDARRDAIPG